MVSSLPPQDELTTGLFGKLPNHADFLRVNVSGVGLEFAAYLEGAMDVCRRATCELAVPESYFVYCAPKSPTALVGLLRPSSDTVGRIFPVTLFTEIEVESAAGNFDILPSAFAPFFEAAVGLAADGANVTLDELGERVSALPFPSIEEFEAAQAQGDTLLLETQLSSFGEAPFGNSAKEWLHLAFSTVAAACEQSRDVVNDTKLGMTLDLPLVGVHDVVLWLGVVRRLLGEQTACPNILWTPSRSSPSCGSVKVEVPPTPGRLLVSFGAPSPSALAFLAGSLHDSPRLWQVTSSDEAAVARAKDALAPGQREVLSDPEATLEAVVAAFEG